MISIVIPVHNEEGNPLVIAKAFADLFKDEHYELLFVDDGSTDFTLETLEKVCSIDSNVKAISLSRNFGHQNALYAGIEHSIGEVVVMMDGDLQHPPSVVPDLVNRLKEGYDIANAIRDDAKDKNLGWFKRVTSRFFYQLLNRFAEISIPSAGADFRAITREVADKFLELKESGRFNRGLFAWVGYRQTEVLFIPQERREGQTKYSIRRMVLFALDGLTSFSAFPLRFFFGMGMILIMAGLIYLAFIVYQFTIGVTVDGWSSIVALLVVILGSNLFGLGLIGEYVGRIFIEVKHRPLYLISKKIGFE